MADGRRHSVDIPISRTLVALRRVRSLRDPCTNSMSKFASLLDNVKWETGSNNGISLQFVNREEEVGTGQNVLSSLKCLGIDPTRVEKGNGFTSQRDFSHASRVENISSFDSKGIGGFDDLMDRGMELTCVMPSINPVEDVDSQNYPNAGLSEQIYGSKNPKELNGKVGDFTSRVGSPILSSNYEFSNHGMSLPVDEDVDIADHCNRGCGITYCWSRTPRYRESDLSSDLEDNPLLSENTDQSSFYKNGCFKKHVNSGVGSFHDVPRSLSQKFRPKSFSELVGQEVAVKSLSNAISRGRIASVYLFHGPRGTGKTSMSRIFAAALNCLSLTENKPCILCRECISFFSGRSRDVKEVDSVKVNRTDRLRSLIKSAFIPPVSSRFKIFIIDECQLMRQEAWAAVFNSMDNFSRHVVFIMVSPVIDKLPRSAVSRSQKYHFPKIKDTEISRRLAKICFEEGISFDQGALDFIASKSSGSLRDAETMLDQLSLLGKKITISLTYELFGVVSDDELIELLDLALSSDTSNTVIRARELMRSKIDPMQLITQLANLIMDILAGKCHEGSSEARRLFCTRHTSEEDLQKLNHALKILSDAEKHLRASKNRTTWLTVALLQLNNVDSTSGAINDTRLCLRSTISNKDVGFCSASSEGDILKRIVPFSCDAGKSQIKDEHENGRGTLETMWKRVTESCRSDSFKNFLWKRGKLTSLCINQGLAVAELEFYHPQHVSRAENSWKIIANSFQSILGCNVEIHINLVICPSSLPKGAKARKLLFGLFSCSRRIQQKSLLARSDSDLSDYASEKLSMEHGPISTCSDRRGAHMTEKMSNALRSSRGNVLRSSDASSRMSCTSDQGENKLVLCASEKTSNGTFVSGNDPFMSGGGCQDGGGLRDDSDVLCWRTPTLPLTKAWRETHQNRSSRLIGCVLPCTATH